MDLDFIYTDSNYIEQGYLKNSSLDIEVGKYGDGTNDYQFMLDMFNKRNKSEITEQQHRKIRGLIAYSIKPFLRERLKYK